ncbi:hypothetical protein MSG28_008610 [Choristoneura fumiferana]|uniref:Uncharacterized protein n=1 Tax=Choristoneura fumiferana TaxID=7141 RepID=A0ACC0J7C7_CHOFU|nr:hypothetical protein MSG28_008610 [Choristoneura fumiferana]
MSDDERNILENEQTESISEPPRIPYKMTMEVPVFLTALSISLSGAAVYNILLYRTCVHTLNHSEAECREFLLPDKNEYVELEGEVQKTVSLIVMVRMTIEAIVPTILSLFIGVWSDTHGRKPLVVWPLFGFLWSSMFIVIFSMIDSLGPWWILGIAMPLSFCGGYTMLLTGAYCYVSDITSKKERSLRNTLKMILSTAG